MFESYFTYVSVGRRYEPVASPVPTLYERYTSMPQMTFEPTIPGLRWQRTVHSDCNWQIMSFVTSFKHVARAQVMRNAFRVVLGKPEGEKVLGRATSRREDNINIYLKINDL